MNKTKNGRCVKHIVPEASVLGKFELLVGRLSPVVSDAVYSYGIALLVEDSTVEEMNYMMSRVTLTDNFIMEYWNHPNVDFMKMVETQNINKSLLKYIFDYKINEVEKCHWNAISHHKKLPRKFIKKNIGNLNIPKLKDNGYKITKKLLVKWLMENN